MSKGRSIWLEFNKQNCLVQTGITLTPALWLTSFNGVIEKGNPQLCTDQWNLKNLHSSFSYEFPPPSGPRALLVFITATEAFLYLYLGRTRNETNYCEWIEEEKQFPSPKASQRGWKKFPASLGV